MSEKYKDEYEEGQPHINPDDQPTEEIPVITPEMLAVGTTAVEAASYSEPQGPPPPRPPQPEEKEKDCDDDDDDCPPNIIKGVE